MTKTPPSSIVRLRSNSPPRAKLRAFVSKRPWAGFTPNDHRREAPLPVCPSPCCRRALACLAAIDGHFYRRTHLSPAEYAGLPEVRAWQAKAAAILKVRDPFDFAAREERLLQIHELRLKREEEMEAKWKAGLLDHLYGPYSPKGVMLKSPPKFYADHRPAKFRARTS
jgi:hypothetical protein